MTTTREPSAKAESNPGGTVASQDELKAAFLAKMSELIDMGKNAGFDLAKELGVPPAAEVTLAQRPGDKIGEGIGATWVPWSKNDLDPDDKVPVMCAYIDYLVWPVQDDDGNWKIPVTVNGMVSWLVCGQVNMVHPMFAEVYQTAYNAWVAHRKYAANGPEHAPWSRVGKSQINTWYQSVANTFGMDIEGDNWDGKGLAIVDEMKAAAATA